MNTLASVPFLAGCRFNPDARHAQGHTRSGLDKRSGQHCQYRKSLDSVEEFMDMLWTRPTCGRTRVLERILLGGVAPRLKCKLHIASESLFLVLFVSVFFGLEPGRAGVSWGPDPTGRRGGAVSRAALSAGRQRLHKPSSDLHRYALELGRRLACRRTGRVSDSLSQILKPNDCWCACNGVWLSIIALSSLG